MTNAPKLPNHSTIPDFSIYRIAANGLMHIFEVRTEYIMIVIKDDRKYLEI